MKTKILTVFLFSISVLVFSQHKFMKYPEFNKNELSKTKSTIKEDAPAEILYSSISNLIINGQLETKVFKRIKIYNKEKSSQYLDVEIPLYEGNGERESVSGLKAVTYNFSLEIPEGYKLAEVPKSVQLNSEFGNYSLQFSMENGKLVTQRKITILKNIYPKEKYKEYIEFRKKTNNLDNTKILLTKI